MKEFIKKLNKDKIKISWNKNPIKMDLFVSFLIVETDRSKKHLGSDTGWTLLFGGNDLEISGGVVQGVEYLDSLKYKENLDNHYNNFVNPFYLFEILTKEGKEFFIDYYIDDIKKQLINASYNVELALNRVKNLKETKVKTLNFWAELGVPHD